MITTPKQRNAIKSELLGEICQLVHKKLTLLQLEKAVEKLQNDMLPNCSAVTKRVLWNLAYYLQHYHYELKSFEKCFKQYFSKVGKEI